MDVDVLRVFTDAEGHFGNPLGVVESAAVAPEMRQRVASELGYSETVFIEKPPAGATTARMRIFTPLTELPFAGHPTVGAAWWLAAQSIPLRTLQVPAGLVQVRRSGELTEVIARVEWAPDFDIHRLPSLSELTAAAPGDYPDSVEHYVWTWTDHEAGEVRSRMFAARLGVPEDEATGSAAARLTEQLGRDLIITQGRGSQIFTTFSPDGWVTIAGRVVSDGVRRLDLDSLR